MAPPSIDKRFAILCEITRAQHFAWRQAIQELLPDLDTAAVVDRMWKITGVQTAKAYAKRIDMNQPIAPQVAKSVAWSSQCMGEDADVEAADVEAADSEDGGCEGGKDGAFLRHADCPWFHWHKRLGLLSEDRPGCDAWFASTLQTLSEAIGVKVEFETLESLPDGDPCCRRRFWVAAK